MSPISRPRDARFFASVTELRAWFDANHATAEELWLGYHRKATGRSSVTWPEAVEEALRVGWIDGIRYALDEGRSAQRFTPRRPGSTWSARNVATAERLIAEGRMRPTGRAAFEARTPERTAVYSYEREAAAFNDEEAERFQANAAAWADWQRRPPSYRKAVTFWVVSAKRPETRASRFAMLLDDSAAGRAVKPMRGPGAASPKSPATGKAVRHRT